MGRNAAKFAERRTTTHHSGVSGTGTISVAETEGSIVSQCLNTELDTLVARGLMLPGGDDDRWQFLLDLAERTVRGDVTRVQAGVMCTLFGLTLGDLEAATARARGIN